MEMTTVQGRVADANGTQAQTYGGAGSLAACVKVQIAQLKTDGSLLVLSEGALKADGTYALKVAAGLKKLIIRGVDATGKVVVSAILEATGSVGGTVTATTLDAESSIEAEVLIKMVSLGVALADCNVIELRDRITTDVAVAVKAAADFEAKIEAIAEAEAAAEVTEIKEYAALGINTTQSALFDLQLAAAQKLDAAIYAAGSASASAYAQAYLAFHNELRASLLALDGNLKKHLRALSCSSVVFRAVVKARLSANGYVVADALLRAQASLEARASAAVVSSLLLAGAAAADATTLATNAAVQLSAQTSAAVSAAASAAAFVSYNTAIGGSGVVTGSVLGTYLGVDATTSATLQGAVTAVAGASAALGGRPGFFLTVSIGSGAGAAVFLVSLTAGFAAALTAVLVVGLAGAAALAGVFDAGTGRAFGSGLAAGAGFTDLAVGAGARAALVFAGVFAGFFATGAGVTGFLVF